MIIRWMKNFDIRDVVKIHCQSFPDFFLSFLGRGFLTVYYKACISDKSGICYVSVEDGDTLSGFVVGSSNPKYFYTRLLKKYWFLFALASFMPILRRPAIAFRLIRALNYPSENPKGDDCSGLYSIAVSPEWQKAGRGKMLVQQFINEAQRRGCRRIYLTTDRDNNEKVNSFYSNMGFGISRRYCTPEGRWMNEYVYYIR